LPALTPLPEADSRQAAAQMMQASAPELPVSPLGSVRTEVKVPFTGGVGEAPGGLAGRPGEARGGSGKSEGGAGEGEEPAFDLVTGGGRNRGNGRGNGIDRGASTDRQPQLLTFAANSDFTLPMKYQFHPPEKSVKFKITVAADGAISEVKLDQSCGVEDIDTLARAYVIANLRFSPAYRAGKAVEGEFPFEISFKPFD
jgi:hypothetical protein